MTTPQIVEYKTGFQHTRNIIDYEILFSTKQMKFLKPVYTERAVSGKLHYRLTPGHYLKFSLYIWRSQVVFKLYTVDIVDKENISENEIVNEKFDSEFLRQIKDDPEAPKPLIDFLFMKPAYHSSPFIFDTKYEYKDAMEMVRQIRDYLQGLLISEGVDI